VLRVDKHEARRTEDVGIAAHGFIFARAPLARDPDGIAYVMRYEVLVGTIVPSPARFAKEDSFRSGIVREHVRPDAVANVPIEMDRSDFGIVGTPHRNFVHRVDRRIRDIAAHHHTVLQLDGHYNTARQYSLTHKSSAYRANKGTRRQVDFPCATTPQTPSEKLSSVNVWLLHSL
jgi:hypothetical protein